jgi:methionine synthase I (cobalamin-dependent)
MILDGGMGTQIQARGLTADDYRGKWSYPTTFIVIINCLVIII